MGDEGIDPELWPYFEKLLKFRMLWDRLRLAEPLKQFHTDHWHRAYSVTPLRFGRFRGELAFNADPPGAMEKRGMRAWTNEGYEPAAPHAAPLFLGQFHDACKDISNYIDGDIFTYDYPPTYVSRAHARREEAVGNIIERTTS